MLKSLTCCELMFLKTAKESLINTELEELQMQVSLKTNCDTIVS